MDDPEKSSLRVQLQGMTDDVWPVVMRYAVEEMAEDDQRFLIAVIVDRAEGRSYADKDKTLADLIADIFEELDIDIGASFGDG